MSRIPFYRRLIMNIEGNIPQVQRAYMPIDEAYRTLRESTGQDFHEDLDKWKKWLKDNKKH